MGESEPPHLPEGYKIEAESDLLILKRPDGSPVAAFEFSAIGLELKRLWEIAWDDAEPTEEP